MLPAARALAVLLVLAAAARSADNFDPTSLYETRSIEGWTVRVHLSLLHDAPALGDSTLALLADQLRDIVRRVPPGAVDQLRHVVIWVELREPHTACMAYHPAAPWLRDHGMNPDKAHCVEIANARNFLDWCRDQPWMVLHELAHAYHHQFVDGGFENPQVANALKKARDAGRYDNVLHINGRTERHYALTNPMEYFAEGSEALFGTNDFYPFVRAELVQHDPEGARVLKQLWGIGPH
jgi:hypothetical protein